MKYIKNFRKAIFLPVVILLITSCAKQNDTNQPATSSDSYADLKSLPKDNGGSNTPVYLNNGITYGYYIYTPSSYQSSQETFPLLIFLHGGGEIGNSMINPGDLNKVLAHGPPQMISQHKWAPTYPMIVVSPQSTHIGFSTAELNNFIAYIISKYKINTHRIYMTGLSMGGFATFRYLVNYPNGYVAASVPMSAFDKQPDYSIFKNLPIWAFCGGDDSNLPQLIVTINSILSLKPSIKPKFTVFPGVGHNCWSQAYSGSGMGLESKSYDAFNISIYDWMFQYSK